jgi:hypothetical protein
MLFLWWRHNVLQLRVVASSFAPRALRARRVFF